MPKMKIHKAIILGKPRLVERLCKSGIDFNQKNLDGYSPLHLAVIHNKPKIVKMLLDFEANVSILDDKNKNPLDTAIILGKSNLVKVFVQSLGLEKIVSVHKNSTPIHLAVLYNRINVLKTLIKFGARVDETDSHGNTPLHIAVKKGSFKLVKLLLEYGANPNSYNLGRNTALHLAVSAKKKNVVKILIEYNGLVNAVDKSLYTPLHIAAMNNYSDIVKILISSGADTEHTEDDLNTPLHLAALKGCFEAAEVLIISGAKVNSRNDKGETPLHMAVITGNENIVEKLIQENANVYIDDDYGWSPLEIALLLCKPKVVEILCQAGGFDNYKTRQPNFILRYCEAVFIQTYKDIKEICKDGDISIATYCATSNDKQLVERLLNYDVSVSDLLETVKKFIKYEILHNDEGSEMYKITLTPQKSVLYDTLLPHIEECFKEVLCMKKIIVPFSSFDNLMNDLSILKAITVHDKENRMAHPSFALHCIDHILDIDQTNAFPIYRDLLVSRVQKSFLKKELLKHVFYTRRENSDIKIFMDMGSLSLVSENLLNIDILNLILAIQNS